MQSEIILKAAVNTKNWGDRVAPTLFEMISTVKPTVIPISREYTGDRNQIVYLTIGSVLNYSDENSIVWGSGFIKDEDSLNYGRPRKVYAVRGPLSRKRLLELGVDCPEVYGDPALLFPRFYTPKKLEQKKIGIIPHYVDQGHPWLEKIKENKDVRIIDIKGDEYNFIDELASCDVIASSSLHGIIVADAYKVPSVWLKFSNKIIGDEFKYMDYFLSVDRHDEKPMRITEDTMVEEILSNVRNHEIKIDLDKLYESCPFRKI